MESKSSKTDNPQAPHPQTEHKHPPEWEEDLNPNRMAGQNIGEQSTEQEVGIPTAYDVKEVHRSLSGFQDDELKQIPVLPEGTRLQQGATYVDLRQSERSEFTATGQMEAGAQNRYVPKDQVPYSIWNRLIGVDNPERTLEGEEPRG